MQFDCKMFFERLFLPRCFAWLAFMWLHANFLGSNNVSDNEDSANKLIESYRGNEVLNANRSTGNSVLHICTRNHFVGNVVLDSLKFKKLLELQGQS